jgi:hypothetical protein
VRVRIHEIVGRYCGQESIRVARVGCPECERTFRVLPEFVVPYKSYGARVVGWVIGEWKRSGKKYGAAKGAGVEARQVRRWVKWWKIVEAVARAGGLEQISYEEGWLSELLKRFRKWKGTTVCET